jgi:hypothetical protein
VKRDATLVAVAAALGIIAALLWPRSDASSGTDPQRISPSADTRAPAVAAPPKVPPARPAAKIIDVEAGPIEQDPAAPGYDPTRLTHFGISAAEIFDREPRDRLWAPAMEQRMRARMQRDLAIVQPTARVSAVECRTSSCEFAIEADEPLSESAQFALQILGNADVHSIAFAERSPEGGESVTYHALYAPDHRGLDENAAYYQDRRESILRQAREVEDFDLVLPIDPETE